MAFHKNDFDVYQRILTLNKYCPKNAAFIMDAFTKSKNIEEIRDEEKDSNYMKFNGQGAIPRSRREQFEINLFVIIQERTLTIPTT